MSRFITDGKSIIKTKAKCPECGRVFDLTESNDANEWAYGHDCE
jgi:ribosomal protein S27AE